jgi:uncharacterized protein (TIGR02145 family)
MKKIIILLALLCTAVFAQQKSTFTDTRDGKAYKTTKIGKQTWMAENLDHHGEGGYLGLCYGDEPKKKIRKPENCKKYGRLYDWNEAMKACPSGWHLPDTTEWQTLIDFAGGKDVAGKKLKSKTDWELYDFSGKNPKAPKCKYTTEEQIDERGRVTAGIELDKCATDKFGFSALPGGYGDSGGYFIYVGYYGYWWSSQEYNSDYAYSRDMSYNCEYAYYNFYDKGYLFGVRCVQD